MTPAPGGEERRRHERVAGDGPKISARIEVDLGGSSTLFSVANLSAGGALVEGHLPVDPGATVNLRILLSGVKPIPLRARVLRHVTIEQTSHTAVMFFASSEVLGSWVTDAVLQGLRRTFPQL